MATSLENGPATAHFNLGPTTAASGFPVPGSRRDGPSRRHHQRDLNRQVSIHAPREGRDPPPNPATRASSPFQSTRPVKGATERALAGRRQIVVSIHAPREGRDSVATTAARSSTRFQSTRPVKGATCASASFTRRATFQSTRPVKGATCPRNDAALAHALFQSTRPVKGATHAVRGGALDGRSFNPRAP